MIQPLKTHTENTSMSTLVSKLIPSKRELKDSHRADVSSSRSWIRQAPSSLVSLENMNM